ncbi:MAG: metallopeptidase TldD-related protein [Rhizomicrobium sp.]
MTKLTPQDLLAQLLAAAKAAGADGADALYAENVSTGVSYRLGKTEEVERSEAADLGLRVFVGQKVATVSTTDMSPDSLAALPERALTMARLAPEDAFAHLAPAEMLAKEWPELDLCDLDEPSAVTLIERARATEEAALEVEGITNSEGGSASYSQSHVALATSTGFYGSYGSSSHGISVSVLAGSGDAMERDYDFSSARFAADLDTPHNVGLRAAQRTIARLQPRKVKSQSVPVVFSPRASNSLLGHFLGAISGTAIARNVSFLKDKMGQRVFAPGVTLIDDPHIRRGLRSKPFDGEGVANAVLKPIEDGILTSWILDCASARQLGLATNGRAARGTGGPPGPSATNFYMQAGAVSARKLIADIDQGLYVVELMGMGVNPVTGDYSRGAAGFWIEKGVISYPVSEVTIAGNLIDMYASLTPASDLAFLYGIDAPTVRIEEMTVAGA